jgi:ABC-type sugar transport system ATPase subunit
MIAVENAEIRNGAFVLKDIQLFIPTGEYGVLMGKTGCGKTTILEALCGLKCLQHGRILLMDRDVTVLKAADRGAGYVPQDTVLFPTMTVREHLSFALGIRKWPRRALEARVEELADLLNLEPLLHRRPFGLSGGEAQRVALGRALASRPDILCLDEPLSALDHESRIEMCAFLETIKLRTHVTTLHVTHSRHEADRLADKLFVMVNGRIHAADSRVEGLPEVDEEGSSFEGLGTRG